jgi:hypothetical protein
MDQFDATPAPTNDFSSSLELGSDIVRGAGYVHIAGNNEKGAVIVNEDDPLQSFGNDDVYVSMFDTETGDTVWVMQVGSFGNDRIAHGGDITCDKNGKCSGIWRHKRRVVPPSNGDLDPSFSTCFCQFSTKQTELIIQLKKYSKQHLWHFSLYSSTSFDNKSI